MIRQLRTVWWGLHEFTTLDEGHLDCVLLPKIALRGKSMANANHY